MRFVIALFASAVICLADIRIKVLDAHGNEIPSARIDVLSPAGNVIHSGSVTVPDVPRGSLIRISAPGFGEALVVAAPELVVTLDPVRVSTQITVSATPISRSLSAGSLVRRFKGNTASESILPGSACECLRMK